MKRDELKTLLAGVLDGSATLDEAVAQLERLPLRDLGFARVDTHRELRQGMPEAIYAEHKTPEQVVAIAGALLESTSSAVIATRVPDATARRLLEEWPEARHDADARLVVLRSTRDEHAPAGTLAVVSGGTSDRPVAMEAALTGDAFTAERAYQLGMVNEVVDDGDDVLKRALALAERITANAPVAVWETRKVVLAAQHADDDTLWGMTGAAFGAVMQTEDFAEGPRAFIEKRPPEWKGR